jgi:hypothetical protein
MSITAPVRAADIALASDTAYSTEGYFVISLSADTPPETTAILEQSASEDFSDAREYVLPANGDITITGLPDGFYHFRARLADGTFGEPLMIEVAHHSLVKAFSFFFVGLALFITLVATILLGNRHVREADHAG